MPKVGTAQYFKERLTYYNTNLSKNKLTGECPSLWRILKSIWRAFQELFCPGRVINKLIGRVSNLKEAFQNDKYSESIENYSRKEEWLQPYLKEWKTKMLEQRKALEGKLEGLDPTKLTNYTYISHLVKKVDQFRTIQTRGCLELNLSFLHFVEEKVKDALKQESDKVTAKSNEFIDYCANESSRQVVKQCLTQFYDPLFKEMHTVQKEINEEWEEDDVRNGFFLMKGTADEIQSLAQKSDYYVALSEPAIQIALHRESTQALLSAFGSVSVEEFEKLMQKNEGIGQALMESLDQIQENTLEWIPGELKDEYSIKTISLIAHWRQDLAETQSDTQALGIMVEQAQAHAKDEQFIHDIEQQGFERVKVEPDGNCLFSACLKGLKEMKGINPALKSLDAQQFRQQIFAYMQEHKNDYEFWVKEQIKDDLEKALKKEDEGQFAAFLETLPPALHMPFIEEKLQSDSEKFDRWLENHAFDAYVKSMASSNAYGNSVEIKAIHEMTQMPIHVFNNLGLTPDYGDYPAEKSHAIHLIRPAQTPHFDYIRPPDLVGLA